MSHTFVVFERAYYDDGSPVGRTEALAACMEQLVEANAEDPSIGAAVLLLAGGERVEIDLARAGRA